MGSPPDAAKVSRLNATTKVLPLSLQKSSRSRARRIYIGSNCKNCCRPAPPGTRSTVRCGTWKQRFPANAPGSWPTSRKRHCSRRPVGDEHASQRIAPEVNETTFTISLDSPEAMATAAKAVPNLPILKLKLGGDEGDLRRVEAVRETAPKARLLVDANESWTPDHYQRSCHSLAEFGIELIEQPFPADANDILKTLDHPIPVCADESCHTTADLSGLKNRYEAINIKLDKTGGLTEALLLVERCTSGRLQIISRVHGLHLVRNCSCSPTRRRRRLD